jgi:hypothetical protein
MNRELRKKYTATGYRSYSPSRDYQKKEVDVVLKDGTEIIHCWPNAEEFHGLGEQKGSWPESQIAMIRDSILGYGEDKIKELGPDRRVAVIGPGYTPQSILALREFAHVKGLEVMEQADYQTLLQKLQKPVQEAFKENAQQKARRLSIVEEAARKREARANRLQRNAERSLVNYQITAGAGKTDVQSVEQQSDHDQN